MYARSSRTGSATPSSALLGSAGPAATADLTIHVYNKYTKDKVEDEGLIYYPWLADSELLEPYIPSTLAVVDYSPSASYTWTIQGAKLYGPQVTYTCTTVAKMEVEVTETTNGVVTRHFQGIWYCKYVRREIRTLTDEDRESFFEALQVLYNVNQADGELLYGSDYRSMEHLVLVHNNLAGAFECDHAHDGTGFLTTHSAYTNEMETSLHAVNPAVSIPYWDFTIEQTEVHKHGGDMSYWYKSIMFSDDWFGPAISDDVQKIVTKGRFAYTKIQSGMEGRPDVHNAFGLTRAAWNLNPAKYLTRCTTMMGIQANSGPSCKDHYDVLHKDTWASFSKSIPYNPHGTVHLVLGGTWGTNYLELFDAINYDTGYDMYKVAQGAFALQKNMWRKGFYVCPTECAVDASIDDCKCTCPQLHEWQYDDAKLSQMISLMTSLEPYTRDKDGNDITYEFLRIVCNDHDGQTTYLGDHLESASPIDPTFWPLHPTIERLLLWKKLAIGFTEETWYYHEGNCLGHNPEDLVPFSNIFPGQDHLYKNTELYHILSPYNDLLPYVYDNFKWDHCVEEGYDLQLL